MENYDHYLKQNLQYRKQIRYQNHAKNSAHGGRDTKNPSTNKSQTDNVNSNVSSVQGYQAYEVPKGFSNKKSIQISASQRSNTLQHKNDHRPPRHQF